jgi:hypothetical protein
VALGAANVLVAAWTRRRRNPRDIDRQAKANAGDPTSNREKETNDDYGPSEDKEDNACASVSVSLVPPFPWESSKLSDNSEGSGGSKRTINPHHHPSKKISPSEAVQQLEFLSNMTFANGGLRAPNCPCCV